MSPAERALRRRKAEKLVLAGIPTTTLEQAGRWRVLAGELRIAADETERTGDDLGVAGLRVGVIPLRLTSEQMRVLARVADALAIESIECPCGDHPEWEEDDHGDLSR